MKQARSAFFTSDTAATTHSRHVQESRARFLNWHKPYYCVQPQQACPYTAHSFHGPTSGATVCFGVYDKGGRCYGSGARLILFFLRLGSRLHQNVKAASPSCIWRTGESIQIPGFTGSTEATNIFHVLKLEQHTIYLGDPTEIYWLNTLC